MPLTDRPTDYERDAAGLAQENTDLLTANCFYRRNLLEEVGGFDERFGAVWREDSDLHFTVLERGCQIEYASAAVITHLVRPAQWSISLIQQMKRMYKALLYKKQPHLYRQRIQSTSPLHYYGIVLAALAVVVSHTVGFGWLTLPAVLWALLTGRFCLKRLHGTTHDSVHIAEMAVTPMFISFFSVYRRLTGAVKYISFFF